MDKHKGCLSYFTIKPTVEEGAMTSLASAFVPNSGRPERHLQAEPMSAT
ncbi:hypothetical protein EMGR_001263 [Emarellia grisea]